MGMGLLILEYGGILRSVMCALLILGLVFSGFIHKWPEIGGVSDSRKTHFLTDEEKRTPPVLTARDFKIREGEPLNIQSHVLAVDFDEELWQEDVSAFREACVSFGITPAVERSRSGNGAHIWFFFSEPVPAVDARKLGSGLLTQAMARRHELQFKS